MGDGSDDRSLSTSGLRRLQSIGRQPPPTDFLRMGRVLDIKDHNDVADIPIHTWGEVNVPTIERKSVNAFVGSFEKSYLPRFSLLRDVKYFSPTSGCLAALYRS